MNICAECSGNVQILYCCTECRRMVCQSCRGQCGHCDRMLCPRCRAMDVHKGKATFGQNQEERMRIVER